MGAGQPNWQKLHEMGKLPKEARGKVPILNQLDTLEACLEKIKDGCCEDCRTKFFPEQEAKKVSGEEGFTAQCEVEGCDFIAEGKSEAVAKNNLRLHTRSHASKE